jgi:hypothetical protein
MPQLKNHDYACSGMNAAARSACGRVLGIVIDINDQSSPTAINETWSGAVCQTGYYR